jgi:hypothetical protein
MTATVEELARLANRCERVLPKLGSATAEELHELRTAAKDLELESLLHMGSPIPPILPIPWTMVERLDLALRPWEGGEHV